MLWQIERVVSKGKYNYAVVKNHPKATKNGYVLEHRIIVENDLGRMLCDNEIIHHKNKNGKDNRLENLQVMSPKAHATLHGREQVARFVKLKCPCCASVFDIQKNKSYLIKGYECSCCSRHCRGVFHRKIQLEGHTAEIVQAISENFLEEYTKHTPVAERI